VGNDLGSDNADLLYAGMGWSTRTPVVQERVGLERVKGAALVAKTCQSVIQLGVQADDAVLVEAK